ncbi:peptide ABC transporter permease [Labrys miyagiensis]|uniref:Peptide ABC transporter permease n=1 Tax=Labrys miyagiensis TaxID=346912 RepID=A0ABQ6CVB6_9HYPH|nr:peptide ABC transporter permease [Labrys miyagiensis]
MRPGLLLGTAILAFWVLCAVFGPSLVPIDPYADDILSSLTPPDTTHWFGTDQLGRDVFARVIVGARDILTIAPLATVLGVGVGSILGLVLGYVGGITDAIVGRLLDALMSLPLIVLALMTLVAVGSSNLAVIAVIGLVYAPLVARTVRTAVRAERERDYVSAARLSGAGALSIMLSEILPNVRQPILIEGIVRLGYAFFTVATLSFLGLGIQPPSPDWGLAIADGYGFLTGGFWWVVAFNALAIISLVVATNLIADGLGAFDA